MAVQSGVYRGVSAEDRVAERRERLVEATLAVWSRPDTRPTMTAVCAEAGLTERYFYESFTHLDDALAAVLDQIAEEIGAATDAAFAGAAHAGPTDRVRASVRAFVELLADDPRKGRVALIEAGSMPALRARRTDLLRRFARRSAEEGRLLYGDDGWGPRAGELAGLLFVGGLAELVTAWLEGAVDVSADELVEAATALYVGMARGL